MEGNKKAKMTEEEKLQRLGRDVREVNTAQLAIDLARKRYKSIVNKSIDDNGKEKTLLMIGVETGNLEIVKLLIASGAEIKELPNKNTILHHAARWSTREVCSYLLDNGCSDFINDSELKKHAARLTPLHCACQNTNHSGVAELLISKGAHMDALYLSDTPLHTAAKCGNAEAIQAIIDASNTLGASQKDELINAKGDKRMTAVHLAVIGGHIEALRILLTVANPDLKDSDPMTPLGYAIMKADHPIIDMLIAADANFALAHSLLLEWALRHKKYDKFGTWTKEGAFLTKNSIKLIEDMMKNGADVSSYVKNIATALRDRQSEILSSLQQLPARDKRSLEEADNFEKYCKWFYSPAVMNHAALFLFFLIETIESIKKASERESNIEQQKKEQDECITFYQSARIVLDTSFILPENLARDFFENEGKQPNFSYANHKQDHELLDRAPVKFSLLTSIVHLENKLIQHSHVQQTLDFKWKQELTSKRDRWGFRNPKKRTRLQKVLGYFLYGRRAGFFLAVAVYAVFVGLITSIALLSSNNDPLLFELTKKQAAVWGEETFLGITDRESFWEWAAGDFVEGVEALQQNDSKSDLLSSLIRFRQLRVDLKDDCPSRDGDEDSVCYPTWNKERDSEDRYGPPGDEWNHTQIYGNDFKSITGITYFGEGGFVYAINPSSVSLDVMSLNNSNWIDEQTAVIFVEYVIWTASLGRYSIGRMVVETLKTGTYVPWASYDVLTSRQDALLIALETLFIFQVLYYIAIEIYELRQFGWKIYWDDIWNYTDVFLMAFSLICIALRATVVISMGKLPSSDYEDSKSEDSESNFSKFENVLVIQHHTNALISCLVIVAWINWLRYLRVIEQLGVLLRIIRKMLYDVLMFACVYLLVAVSFALAFHIMIGHKVHDFRDWGYSILAMLRMTVGDSDWETIENTNFVFVKLLYYVYMVLAAVLFLNLLIAMLNKSYSDVIAKATLEYQLEVTENIFESPTPNSLQP
eukprot:TRINITY_DN2459_c0_g1_i1.p1 TRINITY_DN2459_c0_g1~~TRINITY_DN2459_c0_g1_i1.p1  ORF type:complete len:988 (+),score=147.97 TRINITY_DN2459_c0_g1_i1:16-2979(+)